MRFSKSNTKNTKQNFIYLDQSKQILLNDKKYKDKLHDTLYSPSRYLDQSDEIIIGKKITGPVYNNQNLIKPYSVIGGKPIEKIFNQLSPKRRQIRSIQTIEHLSEINSRKFSLKNLINISSFPSTKNETEISEIDDYMLDMKMQHIQNSQYENFMKDKDFYKSMPQYSKSLLKRQEKTIDKYNDYLLKSEAVSDRISSKIKRPKFELLMNSQIENHNRKKIIYKKKPVMPTVLTWMNTLRTSERETFRKSYINVNTDRKPVLMQYISTKENAAFSLKPNKTNHLPEIKLDKHSSMRLQPNIEKVKHLDNNILIGKNLLELERDMANSIKGKKIQYEFYYNQANFLSNTQRNTVSNEEFYKSSYPLN